MEREVQGQGHDDVTMRNRRKSEMYNNPFPWIAKTAVAANKGKSKFLDLKEKMQNRVKDLKERQSQGQFHMSHSL